MIQRIEGKIAEIQSISSCLTDLVERGPGDDRPNCPILDDRAGDA